MFGFRRPSLRRVVVAVALAVLTAFAFAGSAQAAFPGLNGKVAFERDCDFFEAPVRSGVGADRGVDPPGESRQVLDGVLGCEEGVWTINPDGTGGKPLTDPAKSDDKPAWSADGKRLAFDRGASGDSGNNDIWVMNADGTNPQNLTNHPTEESLNPAWSPDGTKIVFVRRGSTQDQLWVMNSDGGGQHVLITPPSDRADGDPAWSPDGTKIAFDRFDNTGHGQIYVVGADGSGTPTNISNNADSDSSPNWAPDGSKIVFVKMPGNSGDSGISVMGPDGGSPKQLTVGSAFPTPNGTRDEAPAFSPDGTLIAFVRRSTDSLNPMQGQKQVWVMGADASNPHNLSNTPPAGLDDLPDWQPLANVASAAQVPPCTNTGSVTVTVSDPSGFKSGPKAVHFRLDGGAEQTAATIGNTGIVNVPVGRHALEYWGENQAGDQETSHHSASVLVDKTRPHIVFVRDQHRATFRRGETATVTIKVTDSGGSGLSRNPSRRHLRISTIGLGTHTVRAVATDGCGNTATALLRYRVAQIAVVHRRVRFTG